MDEMPERVRQWLATRTPADFVTAHTVFLRMCPGSPEAGFLLDELRSMSGCHGEPPCKELIEQAGHVWIPVDYERLMRNKMLPKKRADKAIRCLLRRHILCKAVMPTSGRAAVYVRIDEPVFAPAYAEALRQLEQAQREA
jgi:hypothetical protein